MLLLFADDTKLCRRILSENDEILLQQDLDKLMECMDKAMVSAVEYREV